MRNRPVKLKARRRFFSNSKWNIGADSIEDLRTGTTVEDYVVLEAVTPRDDKVTGCTVLPIFKDHILLLRNYRHPVDQYFWEGARGFIEKGEEPSSAALREVEEEVGLIANTSDVIPLGYCFPESSTMIARAALFAIVGLTISTEKLDKDEPGLGEARAFTFAEINQMMGAHKIEDATTCIAIDRYMRSRRIS